jgi:rare lipoprotein A (peptidoglycan hydrolase)
VLKATPRPKPSHSVRGTASWYCKAGVSVCHNAYPGGLYAAAGPALRVGDWRGRTVTVCGSGNCVNVKLIDWCACGSGRVIDLYSDAFRQLAPLSSGTLSVRVSW